MQRPWYMRAYKPAKRVRYLSYTSPYCAADSVNIVV